MLHLEGVNYLLNYCNFRLFGEVIYLFYTDIQPGWFAIAGAAAMVCGITRTISTIIIVFEVTGQLYLLIPTTVCSVIAYCVLTYFLNIFNLDCKFNYSPHFRCYDQLKRASYDFFDFA